MYSTITKELSTVGMASFITARGMGMLSNSSVFWASSMAMPPKKVRKKRAPKARVFSTPFFFY